MIYDCFSFFNELDLLEIRLEILDSVVDRFVLVEATRTHSNSEKPLYFDQNRKRYSRFLAKIIHVVVDEYPECTSSWTFENLQRNMIMKGLSQCTSNDVILISDLDEIPNPAVICSAKADRIYRLEQQSYAFFLNYKSIKPGHWYGTNVLPYCSLHNAAYLGDRSVPYGPMVLPELNRELTPTAIRAIKSWPVIKNGGWHFTYLGGIEAIRAKLVAFSHQEYNDPSYYSDKRILTDIKRGRVFFHREDRYVVTRPGQGLPRHVRDSVVRYPGLFLPYRWYYPLKNFAFTARELALFFTAHAARKAAKAIVRKVRRWVKRSR